MHLCKSCGINGSFCYLYLRPLIFMGMNFHEFLEFGYLKGIYFRGIIFRGSYFRRTFFRDFAKNRENKFREIAHFLNIYIAKNCT